MSVAPALLDEAPPVPVGEPSAAEMSATHIVLIPSYNSGAKLVETIKEARRFWAPVWVVIDGSTDGSETAARLLAERDPAVKVLRLAENQGKGAAILHGLRLIRQAGFSHVLTMDADGQHPAYLIPSFMAYSAGNPNALVLGRPVFDASAPLVRVVWRKLSNLCTSIETLWVSGGFDSLFGFRVYPVAELLDEMEANRWMRRFDFDAEAAVRLCWRGFVPVNLPAPVRYFTPEQGGVSHFKYLRDNFLLARMHLRLGWGFLGYLFGGQRRRLRSSRH